MHLRDVGVAANGQQPSHGVDECAEGFHKKPDNLDSKAGVVLLELLDPWLMKDQPEIRPEARSPPPHELFYKTWGTLDQSQDLSFGGTLESQPPALVQQPMCHESIVACID